MLLLSSAAFSHLCDCRFSSAEAGYADGECYTDSCDTAQSLLPWVRGPVSDHIGTLSRPCQRRATSRRRPERFAPALVTFDTPITAYQKGIVTSKLVRGCHHPAAGMVYVPRSTGPTCACPQGWPAWARLSSDLRNRHSVPRTQKFGVGATRMLAGNNGHRGSAPNSRRPHRRRLTTSAAGYSDHERIAPPMSPN